MPFATAGRPPKYYFLILRTNKQELYSAATIARLLTMTDLQKNPNFGTSLQQAQFRARQSLARVARKHRLQPAGIVYLGEGNRGNGYPAFTGAQWQAMLSKNHQGTPTEGSQKQSS